jgi:hypothetical protein
LWCEMGGVGVVAWLAGRMDELREGEGERERERESVCVFVGGW